MKLTNFEIYNYAQQLAEAFNDSEQRLPVKLNFFIQKNKSILTSLAQDIEQARMEIAKTYGELNAEGTQFIIKPENTAIVSKEINDLFGLEQEVNIGKIKESHLSDEFPLTVAQMEAIIFMIEEEAN